MQQINKKQNWSNSFTASLASDVVQPQKRDDLRLQIVGSVDGKQPDLSKGTKQKTIATKEGKLNSEPTCSLK